MTGSGRHRVPPFCQVAVGAFGALLWTSAIAGARDFGQWANRDAAIRRWFHSLMMPDFPAVSCCANADGYWSDSFEVKGDHYVAIITDTRADRPLRREHINPGTAIVVPNSKIKWDQGNPTGHGWVFLGAGGVVYCYLPPGGV